jgi:molybdopterin-guanine dinucleotide biosynthesis protein A
MMEKHTKHDKLVRPAARNEWSITGTDCAAIRKLSGAVIAALSGEYRCAYVDSTHQKNNELPALPGMLSEGAWMEYTNQLNHAQLSLLSTAEEDLYPLLRNADLVLVNGNHHQAGRQIIVIDEKKRQSLQKRLPDMQDIRLILLAEGSVELFNYLIEGYSHLPVLSLNDVDGIINFLRAELVASIPPLYGLVLAGGRSIRMGSDKATMHWHGREQRYFLADILQEFCNDVMISCRPEQVNEIGGPYKALPDSFSGLGPYGALLSAFRLNPNAAWLVLAADLPLLNKQTIETLIAARNPSFTATAYAQPGNGKPEPLIAIWEPKAYQSLLYYLSQGYSCPKKVLEKSNIKLIASQQPNELMNVNTPEDREVATKLLSGRNNL